MWTYNRMPSSDEIYHADRQKHKYIAKVGEGKNAKYFYSEKEYQAYLKKRNIVNELKRPIEGLKATSDEESKRTKESLKATVDAFSKERKRTKESLKATVDAFSKERKRTKESLKATVDKIKKKLSSPKKSVKKYVDEGKADVKKVLNSYAGALGIDYIEVKGKKVYQRR